MTIKYVQFTKYKTKKEQTQCSDSVARHSGCTMNTHTSSTTDDSEYYNSFRRVHA